MRVYIYPTPRPFRLYYYYTKGTICQNGEWDKPMTISTVADSDSDLHKYAQCQTSGMWALLQSGPVNWLKNMSLYRTKLYTTVKQSGKLLGARVHHNFLCYIYNLNLDSNL